MSDTFSQLQAAHERLKLLYQVSNVIHSTLDPQQAVQLILREAVSLMGGYGIPYAAVIGAALIEIVRHSLLLAGVDPYWQGTFVGLIIAGALFLERLRRTPAE